MRPISGEQDVVRHPLNELLGTHAHVRLLRVLTEDVEGPIGVGEAAERAGLTEAGARRALRRLAQTGFVQRVGGGRHQQFALRESDSIGRQLRTLFRAETDRYQSLLTRMREALGRLPEIQVAWIDSAPTQSGQPLHIGVLSDSRSLTYLPGEIRRRITPVEEEFDLTIEVHGYSRADAPDVAWETADLLPGYMEVAPTGPAERPPGHEDRERRALQLSRAIAAVLEKNPSLAKRATRHIEALLKSDQGPASHDLREWHTILSKYSRHRLRDFLVSETPRAQRLRQSSPFFAVLSADERDEVMALLEDRP